MYRASSKKPLRIPSLELRTSTETVGRAEARLRKSFTLRLINATSSFNFLKILLDALPVFIRCLTRFWMVVNSIIKAVESSSDESSSKKTSISNEKLSEVDILLILSISSPTLSKKQSNCCSKCNALPHK